MYIIIREAYLESKYHFTLEMIWKFKKKFLMKNPIFKLCLSHLVEQICPPPPHG